MIIQSIESFQVAVPLKKPFKTALRTVTIAESIYVRITVDDGRVGWGEAPPTHVITGESLASIRYAIEEVFAPLLIGQDLRYNEQAFQKLHKAMVRNTSAKAAVDMALYDLISQRAEMPLYQFLGGHKKELETDYTVSVNAPAEMSADAAKYVANGFNVLKVKVGIGEIAEDIARIKAIRDEIGYATKLRLDANQGWEPKEAVFAICKMEDLGLDIELIEQPVLARDFHGLKYVTDHTLTPIMADESVFSVQDAKNILEMRAADLINIKLMKAGGIYQAMKINALAESNGVKCMTGSMIETKIGITAAAHFAASQPNIQYYDFDAPLMLNFETISGGVTYKESKIFFSERSGLGIEKVNKGGEQDDNIT
ncbi:dipeptide epimerase [Viridibacillus sp. YIM B01967]|uniref:Dipeptide epimerase n=1 Tax=Viridibacillus soli TaxID=2798301 RepID=A0ABS1HC15_9BACL|nr:dipeptide epimerase [Viridibacillus soli]MBK3496973.1 dipeptide epimerase [Viridibacillus soli]